MSTDTADVTDGLRFWADSWPRRVTRYQRWATTPAEAAELILDAEDSPDNWPFISVYSFPEGHTKDGNVPRVDRLFIDLDVPDTGEYRGKTRGDPTAAWIRDMSKLLVRARKVARFLLKTQSPESWQVVLSGHKGIHLDLVFPPISAANGDYDQFINGINGYASALKEYLIDATGLDDLEAFIDVDSSDLGRLRRVPNTKHLGASQAFGEDRFCVPVTLEELSELRPADYIELTRSRRDLEEWTQPVPNAKAAEVLTQQIRNAPSTKQRSTSSTFDPGRIEQYESEENGKITLDNLDFVLSDRPCLLAFREREDAFQHRSQSHYFEMYAITQMMDKQVPIEVMIEFFRGLPGFDEEYTRDRINTYISLDYSPMKCETVWKKAPLFCLREPCKIWRSNQAQRNSP